LEIINTTKSFCCKCQSLHDAIIKSENGNVFFDVDCPTGKKCIKISGDAEIFSLLREKSFINNLLNHDNPKKNDFSWLNVLEITNDCNFTCPVCFSCAGEGRKGYLSIDEIIVLAKKIKDLKRKAVSISGGEPTLHPGLIEIISKIKKLGMDVTLLTNGVKMGEEYALAERIKKSGLTYCYIQFDTLNKAVHKKIRGNDFIEVKKKAMDHARKARLSFGIITTIIKDNLSEAGKILRFASTYAPSLTIVTYLAAAKTGRFDLMNEDMVDREEIIRALVKSGEIDNINIDNFWPFPKFMPFGLDIHPDCASLLFLAKNRKGRIEPLEKYVDIKKLYHLMNKAKSKTNIYWGYILFSLYLLRSVRLKYFFKLYAMLMGTLLKIGRSSIMIVAIEQFMSEHYQDQERIDHCTTCNVLRNGTMVPACIYQHPDESRFIYNRKRNSMF
jgi:7,8-dihydro-6-hydroxymethylpterin dimethyltransferase